MHKAGFYETYIKRPQDFILALAGLILCSPLFLGVAALVRVRLGSPVVFSQDRPGKINPKTGNESIFRLYKFRTMTEETDSSGKLLADEKRLTPFGRKLRASSLDELPELFNVLRGDMSLIGPRPLLVQYLERYDANQRRRHEVRPGLTGLSQVHGRNALSWEERLAMDVDYVDHVTFARDWSILFQTIRTVCRREGIHSTTSATMEEFMGSCENRKR